MIAILFIALLVGWAFHRCNNDIREGIRKDKEGR